MEQLSIVLAFIFGTVIGSFLNVVSLRFKTGMGLGGRSKCMSCGKELGFAELIPILSYVFLRGSCKKCKGRISWQYPLVELLSGLLFVIIIYKFPPVSLTLALATLIQLVAACLLIIIMVYDIKHKIIPDRFVFSFDALAFVGLFVGGAAWFHLPSWQSIAAGPILALPFALIWLISRGRWMGLGDAKLTLGIGWMLGLGAGINAVILSFWVGAVCSVIWLFYTFKQFRPRTEIPFGPYLILGLYLVLIFGLQVIDFNLAREVFASLF